MLYITDELSAVNLILASIGEAPVNSLAESESIDADNAKTLLEATSRTIQRQGWQFNTLTNVNVIPDAKSKRVRYNPTWIKFTADNGINYVKRGEYLYNISKQTFDIPDTITATIIEAVDFDDLPDEFKVYIAGQAAILFQARYLGDDSISQELRMEVASAYADLVQYSIDTGSSMYNITGMQSMLERS